jgi:hypothetical protein
MRATQVLCSAQHGGATPAIGAATPAIGGAAEEEVEVAAEEGVIL